MPRRLADVLLLWVGLMLPLGSNATDRAADLDPSLYEAELKPSVTIEEHPNRVVEEYRVNNNVYMIKITPSVGPSYYLIDDDGSGDMEMRRNAAGMDTRVPQWSLFSW